MGREIRMVPENWEHPRQDNGSYQPMYEQNFKDAAAEWKKGLSDWDAGIYPDYCSDESKTLEFWEWQLTPPDREYYAPYSESEKVWVQVYETVSEGTPITPPFATKEELVNYLVDHGDFWHNKWDRNTAEKFVDRGWAPSGVVYNGKFMTGVEFIGSQS